MTTQTTPLLDVNLNIGKRLRRRRRLLGLTQEQLADYIGTKFQQIQKYECAANKVSALRLFQLSVALGVPVNYFYEGLPGYISPNGATTNSHLSVIDSISHETLNLVGEIATLHPTAQKRLLEFVRALREVGPSAQQRSEAA